MLHGPGKETAKQEQSLASQSILKPSLPSLQQQAFPPLPSPPLPSPPLPPFSRQASPHCSHGLQESVLLNSSGSLLQLLSTTIGRERQQHHIMEPKCMLKYLEELRRILAAFDTNLTCCVPRSQIVYSGMPDPPHHHHWVLTHRKARCAWRWRGSSVLVWSAQQV